MRALLRAYLLVEWQMAMNTLRSARSRDAVESLSRLVGAGAKAFAVLMLVPLSVLMAMGGLSAGAYLASEPDGLDPNGPDLLGLRYAPVALLLVIAAAQMFRLSSGTAPPRARLRLLPISRARLHLLELASSLVDPWLVGASCAIVLVPVGMASTGRWRAALLVVPSSLLAVPILVFHASLVSMLHASLVRSPRARGIALTAGAVAVIAAIVAPLGELVPPRPEGATPSWLYLSPGEPYVRAVANGLDHRPAASLAWTGVLGLMAVAGYAASRAAHGGLGVLAGGSRRGRAAPRRPSAFVRGPVTAVAHAAARTVLRSTSGKAAFLFNPPFLGICALALRRAAGIEEPELFFLDPHVFAAAGAILALQTTLGIQVNQLGSDGAGLTMLLLQPLREREIVLGKLLGYGALHLASTAVIVLPLCFVEGTLSAPLWITLALGVVAAYLPAGAAASCISATLPVHADLSSLAKRSAHEVAGFATIAMVFASSIPPLGIALYAVRVLGRPWAAPLLGLAWLAVALLGTVPLVALAAKLVRARRENLALVAQGR